MHETALPLTSSSPTPARDRDERSTRRNWRDQLPVLEGRRVSLRELDASDAATLLPLLAAPEVGRFLSPPPRHFPPVARRRLPGNRRLSASAGNPPTIRRTTGSIRFPASIASSWTRPRRRGSATPSSS